MPSDLAWYESISIEAFFILIVVIVLLSGIRLIMGGVRAFEGRLPWLQLRPPGGRPPVPPGSESEAEERAVAQGQGQRSLAISDAIGLCVAIIVGGGLIWLGLHYGFEFHERLTALLSQPVPVKEKVTAAPAAPGVPTQSWACNTAEGRYGLIIDAGSSGSRIHIYCWKPGGAKGIPWVTAAPAQAKEPWIAEFEPGLSDESCESTPEKCLKDLITYARNKIGNDHIAETPVYLMATAGMRLKTQSNQDKSQNNQDDFMRRVGDYLKTEFKSARTPEIISGNDEALYGWIAVNYMMGFLKEKDGDLSPTVGILELGGRSTQIAYAASPHSLDTQQWDWGGTRYQIYRNSFNLGQDQAFDKINEAYKIKDPSKKDEKEFVPCYLKPVGYTKPEVKTAENKMETYYDLCKKTIELHVNLGEIRQAMKQHRPPKEQDEPPKGIFLAYAAFDYTYSGLLSSLGLFPLEQLEMAGNVYCESDLPTLKSNKGYNDKYWPRYCVNAAYIEYLLQNGYGFPKNTQQIIIANTLHGNKISWTLGAMIDKAKSELR